MSKVYINLIDQKEPTLDLDIKDENIDTQNKSILYFKKIIKPSDEEIKNHKEYLKNHLKKNYF